MAALLAKIKAYWDYILAGLVAILTLAFLFEKSKKDVAEGQVAEQKTQEQVAALQSKVDVNQGQITAEEEKRAEIKKEADATKSDNTDATDFLNKR
jgi:hypothetical protein